MSPGQSIEHLMPIDEHLRIHHRSIDGIFFSRLALGNRQTADLLRIIHVWLIFQWLNQKNISKRRQENAKGDKKFLVSAQKIISKPQNQNICILKNII